MPVRNDVELVLVLNHTQKVNRERPRPDTQVILGCVTKIQASSVAPNDAKVNRGWRQRRVTKRHGDRLRDDLISTCTIMAGFGGYRGFNSPITVLLTLCQRCSERFEKISPFPEDRCGIRVVAPEKISEVNGQVVAMYQETGSLILSTYSPL